MAFEPDYDRSNEVAGLKDDIHHLQIIVGVLLQDSPMEEAHRKEILSITKMSDDRLVRMIRYSKEGYLAIKQKV